MGSSNVKKTVAASSVYAKCRKQGKKPVETISKFTLNLINQKKHSKKKGRVD